MPAVSRPLRYIIGCALALAAASLATYAAPLVTQLSSLITASDSTGASNSDAAKSGSASALSALPTDGSVEVAALALTPGTVEVLDPIIFTAATLSDAVAAGDGVTYSSDAAPPSSGIHDVAAARSASFNGPLNPLSTMPTNGAPHASNQPGVSAAQAAVSATNAASAGRGKGVDALAAVPIGGDPGNRDLLKDLVFSPINNPGSAPQDPVASNPMPMASDPGLLPVQDLNAFPPPIKTKDQVPTNQVPEPGVLMLLALGIACLGIARHRRPA